MIPTINQESQALGRVSVEIMVVNNRDLQMAEGGALAPEKVRRFELTGVVDTGSALLVLPADVADRLGLPKTGDALIHYADRRSATRTLVDQVGIELFGRRGTFTAILEPARTTALIGAIVLETLDLLVDCKTNKLYPRDPDHIIAEVE
jgi:predicted aspartyl protease